MKANPPAPAPPSPLQPKGHTNANSSDSTNFRSMPHGGISNRPPSGGNGSRECAYCHKRDHIISTCPKLKARRQQPPHNHTDTVPKDVGLVAGLDVQAPSGSSEPIFSQLDPFYVPYCQAGYLIGQAGRCKPILILRDTGCTQTLLRRDALPTDQDVT